MLERHSADVLVTFMACLFTNMKLHVKHNAFQMMQSLTDVSVTCECLLEKTPYVKILTLFSCLLFVLMKRPYCFHQNITKSQIVLNMSVNLQNV